MRSPFRDAFQRPGFADLFPQREGMARRKAQILWLASGDGRAAPLGALYAERQAILENERMLAPRLKAAADELPGLRARASELRAAAGTRDRDNAQRRHSGRAHRDKRT